MGVSETIVDDSVGSMGMSSVKVVVPEVGVDQRIFRDAMSRFATGVAVVTTIDGDSRPVGVTVNSLTSVSLDPPLLLWTLGLRAYSLPIFRHSGVFAVNILPADAWETCLQFARPGADKFDGIPWTSDPAGLPLIGGALAHLICTTWRRYPGGDHEIFVGQVERVHIADGTPLVLFQGRPAPLEESPPDSRQTT